MYNKVRFGALPGAAPIIPEERSVPMSGAFSENLINIRKEKGMSQSELADALHLSRQAVSNWERNKSWPGLETLGLIAEALGVSVSELLEEKRDDGLYISRKYLFFNLAAAAVHTVLGICGFVNFFAVTIVPWMCVFMMLIVTLSFRGMFKSGSYDMLAGFNSKKDSVPATRRQMYWLHLLVGILSCIFQLLFTAMYFLPGVEQMDSAVVLMLCYIGSFLAAALAVNFKIKTR